MSQMNRAFLAESLINKDTGEMLPFPTRPQYHLGRLSLSVEGESMTDTSQAELVDVNYIIRQFDRTGVLPEGKGPGVYADVTGLQRDFTDLVSESRVTIGVVNEKLAEQQAAKAAEEAADREAGRKARMASKAAAGSEETPPAAKDSKAGAAGDTAAQ